MGTKNVIRHTDNNVVVAGSKDLLKTYWKRYKKKKSRNGKFVAFDTYRQSLGGRGIWGTKIFFRSLEEIDFLMECDEDSDSAGKYCPTKYAMDKYEDLFVYVEDGNLWGLSEKHLDAFDELIFPALISTARKLEKLFAEEKKEKARLKYKMSKSVNEGKLI